MSKVFRQLLPVITCAILFVVFVLSSLFFIEHLINPYNTEKILLQFHLMDFLVGFFLYFVTAVDYALIIGRMQVSNPGATARFAMNVFTCFGCFVGVTLVLFLWGFAKEIDWLIIVLLIFAGSVMVKLAYESLDYFAEATSIWRPLRLLMVNGVTALHNVTQGLTFWIPELGSPKVERMSITKLASWAFLLPFIIGLDDFVGYMGAMTIYNVFSLLIGIYFADVFIDVLIFTSPALTKKVVESAILSFLASLAFLYLMYKSYSEAAALMLHAQNPTQSREYIVGAVCLAAYLIGRFVHAHSQRSKVVVVK